MPSAENSIFKRKVHYANVGIFAAVIIGVWLLFSVPVILYSTRPVKNHNVSQTFQILIVYSIICYYFCLGRRYLRK